MPPPDPDASDDPIDPWDPRFTAASAPPAGHERRLERSRGPGASPEDPRARILRVALPLVFTAGLIAVAVVFFAGLRAGPQVTVLSRESAVREAVAQRPKRVCFNDNNPCAWLTLIDDRLVAFNTNGPLPQEYGREGIGWCSSSGWFGSNATGSRFDQRGTVAAGPAPRGLDRFAVRTDAQGRVVIDFAQLSTGIQAAQAPPVQPPDGPLCDTIPFDRNADLDVP